MSKRQPIHKEALNAQQRHIKRRVLVTNDDSVAGATTNANDHKDSNDGDASTAVHPSNVEESAGARPASFPVTGSNHSNSNSSEEEDDEEDDQLLQETYNKMQANRNNSSGKGGSDGSAMAQYFDDVTFRRPPWRWANSKAKRDDSGIGSMKKKWSRVVNNKQESEEFKRFMHRFFR